MALSLTKNVLTKEVVFLSKKRLEPRQGSNFVFKFVCRVSRLIKRGRDELTTCVQSTSVQDCTKVTSEVTKTVD